MHVVIALQALTPMWPEAFALIVHLATMAYRGTCAPRQPWF